MADADALNYTELTADVVSAHVANNNVPIADLPKLIQSVYEALSGLGDHPAPAPAEKKEPAVSIRSSVKPDYIVCLEDGKKLTMLKRYLASRYDMTPEQYREKWGLPKDYPMVAPNYAERRRALANAIGLGRKPAAKVEEVVETVAKPVRTRVRKTAEEVAEIVRNRSASASAKGEPEVVPAEQGGAAKDTEQTPRPRRKLKLKTD